VKTRSIARAPGVLGDVRGLEYDGMSRIDTRKTTVHW
jgi:hypothetical protein